MTYIEANKLLENYSLADAIELDCEEAYLTAIHICADADLERLDA